MLVKDQLTGESRPKEELFCVTTTKMDRNGKIKKTNKYYTSKEAYEKWESNKIYRQKCIDLMYEILQYKEFMKLPGFFWKKLSSWESYEYKVVYRCMQNNYKNMCWAIINKDFGSETGKVMYLSAIIENNLNDALKEINAENKLYTSAKNDDIADMIDLDVIGKKQSKKDISRFLEDE